MDITKLHELKTDADSYSAIEGNLKTNTTRINDRNFQAGEYVVLRKTKYTGEEMKNGHPLIYSGVAIMCKITHIEQGHEGIYSAWAVLSLRIIDRHPGRVY